MLISQLTRGDRMDAEALCGPPYTEMAPHGPEDLFAEDKVKRIYAVVD
ncbi:hypothetical protein [Kocuria rosea]|nr:hypothetical protein [Kocuria rosea]